MIRRPRSKVVCHLSLPAAAVALVLGLLLVLGPAGAPALAQDTAFTAAMDDPAYADPPTYLLELNDGELLPPEIVVPARTRFRMLVRNIGTKPAEFESNQLRQEEVLFMGAEAEVTITPLDPGTYDYFDEFDMRVMGRIVAREGGN
jgi:hypothetical protein